MFSLVRNYRAKLTKLKLRSVFFCFFLFFHVSLSTSANVTCESWADSHPCGRPCPCVCCFQGVACTAMLVAVVTKTLALNKGEKHVHFFMLDIQISKRVRAAGRRSSEGHFLDLHASPSRRLLHDRGAARPPRCRKALVWLPPRLLEGFYSLPVLVWLFHNYTSFLPPSKRLCSCLSPSDCCDGLQLPQRPRLGMNGG